MPRGYIRPSCAGLHRNRNARTIRPLMIVSNRNDRALPGKFNVQGALLNRFSGNLESAFIVFVSLLAHGSRAYTCPAIGLLLIFIAKDNTYLYSL